MFFFFQGQGVNDERFMIFGYGVKDKVNLFKLD